MNDALVGCNCIKKDVCVPRECLYSLQSDVMTRNVVMYSAGWESWGRDADNSWLRVTRKNRRRGHHHHGDPGGATAVVAVDFLDFVAKTRTRAATVRYTFAHSL